MTNAERDEELAQVPTRVVVIGAGIAGLTAAHELVERGFEVEVIERAVEPPSGPNREAEIAIGGMARSHYVGAPISADRDGFYGTPGGTTKTHHLHRIEVDRMPAPMRLGEEPAAALNAFVSCWRDASAGVELRAPIQLQIVEAVGTLDEEAVFVTQATDTLPPDLSPILLRMWTDQHDEAIEPAKQALGGDVGALQIALIAAYPRPRDRKSGEAQSARRFIRVLHDRLPAEHGFRFFPSFYRHLFDTMRRIPLTRVSPFTSVLRRETFLQEDTHRSLFDNLVPAETFEFALPRDEDGRERSHPVPRRAPRSLEEVRSLLRYAFEDAGYEGSDLARIQTAYVRFLTSSTDRRREELEKQSWAEFLGLDAYSPRFRDHVIGAAQALTAMSSEKNDARTIGTVALQLTLDQMREDSYVDGTLNGPTTTSMLEPWRDFLASQGVVFRAGELIGYEKPQVAEGEEIVVTRPVFASVSHAEGDPHLRKLLDVEPADYYVVTIPVDAFQSLWRDGAPRCTVTDAQDRAIPMLTTAELVALSRQWSAPWADPGDTIESTDLERFIAFPAAPKSFVPPSDPPAGDVGVDAGPMRHMVGIQFFLDTDIRLNKGHTLCQDSPWGISYLSQAQYWRSRIRPYDGFRGVISAIMTRFNYPHRRRGDDGLGKCAWECGPDEIAERVWAQIEVTWDVERNGPLPSPRYFYIDENIRFDGDRVTENRSPYLVNHVADWARRPGRRDGDEYVYDLQMGHTVFAGVLMRTHTRLTTMESANESARRAVNTILRHDGRRLLACRTWRPDDYEVGDLADLKELDRRLHARGERHVLDGPFTRVAVEAIPWDLLRVGLGARR